MTWNYRVFLHEEFGFYQIHRVYIGDGVSWSETPSEPTGDSLSELREDIRRMSVALDKPVVNFVTGKEIK
jgi:hypothetical protein